MIIDFHTHIFPERIAERTVAALATSSRITAYSTGDESGLLDRMEEAGVTLAVNLPVLTRPEQFDSITRFALALNEKYDTSGGILSFAGIHPKDPKLSEHLREIKRLGFKGIKIHPDYQDTFFDSVECISLLGLAKELDLITVTHAGFDPAYEGQPIKCTPERVVRALERIGGYPRLVLAHMGGNELFLESLELLAGKDVYIDTSFVLPAMGRETFIKFLEKHSEDRILFATDSPWRSIREEVERIRSFDIGKRPQDKIFSLNARSLLGI